MAMLDEAMNRTKLPAIYTTPETSRRKLAADHRTIADGNSDPRA